MMAPAFRGGRRKTRCKIRLGHLKKISKPSSEQPTDDDDSSTQVRSELEEKNAIGITVCGFSTPKAKKFLITQHLSCPPAPKKRRISVLRESKNTSPLQFFTSPDLELFFLHAVRGI